MSERIKRGWSEVEVSLPKERTGESPLIQCMHPKGEEIDPIKHQKKGRIKQLQYILHIKPTNLHTHNA